MSHRSGNLDLIFAAFLAVAVAVLVILDPAWHPAVQGATGLLFFLLIPGYLLGTLLFPGRDDLDSIERLVIGLGLSVVSAVIIGLLLDETPWGITPTSTSIGFLLFVVAAALASFFRRRRLEIGERYRIAATRDSWVNLSLIVGVVLAVMVIAELAVVLRASAPPTEFYVLGADGKLDNYRTTAFSAGETLTVTLGVVNHEGAAQSFLIGFPQNPGQPTLETPTLGHNQKWETILTLTVPAAPDVQSLAFHLFREGEEEAYRSLRLMIGAAKSDGRLQAFPSEGGVAGRQPSQSTERGTPTLEVVPPDGEL